MTVLGSGLRAAVTVPADTKGRVAYPAHGESSWAFDDAGNRYSLLETTQQTTFPRGDVMHFSSPQALPWPARIESWRQLDRGGTVVRATQVARDAHGAVLRQIVIDDGSAVAYNSADMPSADDLGSVQRAPQFWLSGQGRGLVATSSLLAARCILLVMQHDKQARLLPEQRLGGARRFRARLYRSGPSRLLPAGAGGAAPVHRRIELPGARLRCDRAAG